MKITILYSGGLDSLIMRHYAQQNYESANVDCLWFDIGQPYNAKEKNALPHFVRQRKIEWLDLLDENGKWLGQSADGIQGKGTETGQIYIPGRNAVLVTQAACMTLPDQVWLGALKGETHKAATDKNDTFCKYMSTSLSYVLSPFRTRSTYGQIQVRFPLADAGFNKLTSVGWALTHGLSKKQIRATSSCLSGEPGNCGKCIVCFRRWGIFKQLGFSEDYNTDPVLSHHSVIQEMLKGEGSYYDIDRQVEVLPALDADYVRHHFGDDAVSYCAKVSVTAEDMLNKVVKA